jgi:uncharacterized membrane protein
MNKAQLSIKVRISKPMFARIFVLELCGCMVLLTFTALGWHTPGPTYTISEYSRSQYFSNAPLPTLHP